jgi:hypothetical protein
LMANPSPRNADERAGESIARSNTFTSVVMSET